MLEDEKKLVETAKDGGVQAFGLLYEFYLPKIYRFVLLKVGHREEAEDLTHQVFVKAWENIDKYEFRGYSFGSWLYQIARNTTIDYYRRRSGVEVSIEELTIELPSEDSVEGKIDDKLDLRKIMKAIKELNEVEQEVLIMRFVDDLPIKEVADAIGKTEGAVKLIQHRAIKNLKKILEP